VSRVMVIAFLVSLVGLVWPSAVQAQIPPIKRITSWAGIFNLTIERQGDVEGYDYQIKDVFTTANGEWCVFTLSQLEECDYAIGGIPSWAMPYAGFEGDDSPRSMFGAVLDTDGRMLQGVPFRYRRSGAQVLHEPMGRVTGPNGWAIHPLEAIDSYSYRPKEEGGRDEPGPWCYGLAFPGEVICGVGMPSGMQISTFVVWQKVPVVSPAKEVSDSTTFLPMFSAEGR
jgi:hypothetical protein